MMEQSDSRKAHGHAILVCGLNHMVVPDRPAGLYDIPHPAPPGPLHVVTEGEKGVGPAGDAGEAGNPRLLLLRRQGLGPLPERILPAPFIRIISS